MKRFYIVPLCLNLLACAPTDGDSTIEEQGRGTPAPEVCSEPVPTIGGHGIGILHNAGLAMLKRKIASGDLRFGDDLSGNMAIASGALVTWLCEMNIDCDKVNEVGAEVTAEMVNIADSVERGGSFVDALSARMINIGNGLPDWFLPTLTTFRTGRATGSAEIKSNIGKMGQDQGCYDGGDYGRIMRSVAAASMAFWSIETEANGGGDGGGGADRDWIFADCAGAGAGAAMGSGLPPAGPIVGGVLGGVLASGAAAGWFD